MRTQKISSEEIEYLLIKIEDLIWEWENGSISPYELVKQLKETTSHHESI